MEGLESSFPVAVRIQLVIALIFSIVPPIFLTGWALWRDKEEHLEKHTTTDQSLAQSNTTRTKEANRQEPAKTTSLTRTVNR